MTLVAMAYPIQTIWIGQKGNGLPDIGEPNFDWTDNEEYTPITTHYSVKNLNTIYESFLPNDTFFVALSKKNIISSSIELKNSTGFVIPSSDYEFDAKLGRIRASNSGSLGSDEHTLSFQYYPIFFNPYIQESIWDDPTKLPYVTEKMIQIFLMGFQSSSAMIGL